MRVVLSVIVLLLLGLNSGAESWIRINQLGYLPDAVKVAVMISDENKEDGGFELCDAITHQPLFKGKMQVADASFFGMKSAARLDFSAFHSSGSYYVRCVGVKSPVFKIGTHVYDGAADFLLRYMRQQRCGFNPYLNDSCHTHDGVIVDHPTLSGTIIDVKGGWHDASDYLQYSTTSINAVFNLLWAYQSHPASFGDDFDANGRPDKNGIPDVLDEARWGLEWMLKMNPDSSTFFNQIADDRDHAGYRLPNDDHVVYGNSLHRPVYFVTGKPQGLGDHKNRTTGVSSVGGKFCSSYALDAQVFAGCDAEFGALLAKKAKDAWNFSVGDLGNTQTACYLSPYFYEEDNFVDDLQLAAWQMFRLTGKDDYLKQADYWGRLESVSPWMIQNGARHYQYYPFVNVAHGLMAQHHEDPNSPFVQYYRDGLQYLKERGKGNAFFIGIPFIWCSNNLVVAALTQAYLYQQATGDTEFAVMEASLRDWLFGCNPWGTSMICGYPHWGDSPMDPHSSITLMKEETTFGGLVDGPVYRYIFEGLRGVILRNDDLYAPFQHGQVVYHDDMGDYSTNEPTMDGTASLSFYLSAMQNLGSSKIKSSNHDEVDRYGAIIRRKTTQKHIYLLFSADTRGEGFPHVIKTLDRNNVKASFFLTGHFLDDKNFSKYVRQLVAKGHYVGPHSDTHLLYNDWDKRDSTIVGHQLFVNDLMSNYSKLYSFGVNRNDKKFFLPPYEWYNGDICQWADELGVTVIGLTPDTGTNADYTTPDMKNYKSSTQLMNRLLQYESRNADGLNGAFLLIHPGTHPDRNDKFYLHLDEMIGLLKQKGYQFKSLK